MNIKFFLGVSDGGFSRLGVPDPNDIKNEPSLKLYKNNEFKTQFNYKPQDPVFSARDYLAFLFFFSEGSSWY